MSGADLARAAEDLVGAPFRLHGREPASGLDCVGVLTAAMASIGRPIIAPNGYAMRRRELGGWLALAGVWGFAEANDPIEPGDVLMFTVGPVQFHLAIAACEGCLVHAHAGLRRVVLGPSGPDWHPAGHWRLVSQE